MFEDRFSGFGGFHGDFNIQRAPSDRRLPDGFLNSLDANPFLKNQKLNTKSDMVGNGLDLCKKLSKMGIACDMSIWSRPEPIRIDPGDFGSRRTTTVLHGFSSGFEQNLGGGAPRIQNGFRGVSSGFLQNTSHGHGVSPAELRLLSVNQNGFEEMMAFENHREFLFDHMDRPIKRSSPSLRAVSFRDDAFMGPFMFEGDRVSHSRTLSAMEASRELRPSSHPEFSLRARGGNEALMFEEKRVSRSLAAMDVSLGNEALMFEGKRVSRSLAAMDVSLENEALMFEGKRVSRSLAAMEASGGSRMSLKECDSLPKSLASMVDIYGSVKRMAKDQIGCRVLQKLLDEGTFLDYKVLFHEIFNHVVELSMDPFGNYFVQKLFDGCDEEERTVLVNVLTSKPRELIKMSLNNYGTRVVQKMIETVKTKHQIEMVKSGLKPGFLALVNDLNGNHVIQTCLTSLGQYDNKFVLDAATRHCAEIATHRHGCCVLQCCISNSVGYQRERLVDEIARNSLRLSQDPYGNYVVQYLIESNVSAGKLLMKFRMHYAELATQKFSSHVVEKCLRKYPESRAEIVRELLCVQNFEHLLQDPFGNYVIQTALSVVKGPIRSRLVEKVYRFGKLKSSPYCRKIFTKNFVKK
ncbi:unnamed protein product [Microthlaspi erraticum]|uniref:PUM-HD domain-containing protein n=1 Tax=Microthlaspi erraticum TaxID=1685480 RepID=A0A6D2I0D0_9BRAS|nr:unnamed protein product [Microthlaspi erraticum]